MGTIPALQPQPAVHAISFSQANTHPSQSTYPHTYQAVGSPLTPLNTNPAYTSSGHFRNTSINDNTYEELDEHQAMNNP